MTTPQSVEISQYIQLRGSTTLLTPIQAIGSQYMTDFPKVGLPLLGGGTAIGYKTVLDETADIGMASGAIPEEMEIAARLDKISIRTTTIAYDAITTVVNPLNPISNLSIDQLKEIFSGRITDWSELGKFSGKINVYSYHPHRGTQEPWKRLVLGKEHMTLGAIVIYSHQELFEKLSKDPLGIGYVSATFLDDAKIKVIQVNGYMPTYENLSAHKYPIRNNLMLVTREQTTELVKHFLEYCLDLQKGQALIGKTGLVPVKQG